MGLNRRTKVSAEFNMSSLTDIIFLLLIFFMLTSTLVNIQQFDIPKSDVKTVAPTSVVVEIRKDGDMRLNGAPTNSSKLQRELRSALQKTESNDPTVTIVAESGVGFKKVVDVMEMANSLKAKAILATQPIKQ